MTLQNIPRPVTRSIPRPRHRPRPPDQPQEIKKLRVTQLIPCLKPIKLEPVEKDLPDSLVEGISMPDIPATPGLQIAGWSQDQSAYNYTTTDSYLEMVRLKIERHKKYPDIAKARNVEGRVVIHFVITPDGDIREAEIAKRSRNKALDLAALRAVQDAAPFPKAPAHLFKGEIPLEITIVFELT